MLCLALRKVRGLEKGFTLIELLVVISVVAIVAAMLLPVFVTARAQAKQASCVSNLRQISYAYSMYLGDYSDFYPDNDYGANLWLVEPYLHQRKIKRDISQTHALTVWLCPAADKDMYYWCHDSHWASIASPPPWGAPGSAAKVFNSYVVNNAITNNGRGMPNLVRRPSKTVLFAEGCRQPKRLGGEYGTAPTAVHPHRPDRRGDVIGWCSHVNPGSTSLLHPWHNGGANFMYVDLHVSFLHKPPPIEDGWLP